MSYEYHLINWQRFEAFDLGPNFWTWPTDRKDHFESKEKLLEAVVETMAGWLSYEPRTFTNHGFTNLCQGALHWRNRIWRWKGDTPAGQIQFMGEADYYELDKIPPVTGDIWTDRA